MLHWGAQALANRASAICTPHITSLHLPACLSACLPVCPTDLLSHFGDRLMALVDQSVAAAEAMAQRGGQLGPLPAPVMEEAGRVAAVLQGLLAGLPGGLRADYRDSLPGMLGDVFEWLHLYRCGGPGCGWRGAAGVV